MTLLALIVAASGVMLARANARFGGISDNPAASANALAVAKRALIARAVSDDDRPGELPCPDFNNDGRILVTDDYLGANCRTRLGWLPFAHLGLDEMLDGSSSRIWYAVSDGHSAKSTQPLLNSNVQGELDVDSESDVVAVLFAPGTPFNDQDRASAPSNATAARGQFLEDTNANADLNAFSRSSATLPFNDRLLVITRRELMYQVEKRVANELARTFKDYYMGLRALLKDPNFPWPRTFSDPTSTVVWAHTGGAGVSEGQIALHTTEAGGDITGIEGGFTLSWTGITSPVLTPPTGGFGAGSSMDAADLTDEPAGGLPPIATGEGACRWHPTNGAARAPCLAVKTVPYPDVARVVGARTIDETASSRTFTIDIDVQNNTTNAWNDIDSPLSAPARPRTRTVIANSATGSTFHRFDITVTDNVTYTDTTTETFVGSMSWNAGITSGNATVSGIYYRIDPLIELPVWFEPNDWHELAYVIVSPSMQAGGDDDCSNGTPDCVIVTVGGVDQPDGNVAAVAIIGGSPLPPPSTQRSGTHNIGDYFEVQNAATGDGRRAARGPFTATFNDRVRRVLQANPTEVEF